jgi:hypothetical protein
LDIVRIASPPISNQIAASRCERGGAAEDAELLLAELKAISYSSSSGSRFGSVQTDDSSSVLLLNGKEFARKG